MRFSRRCREVSHNSPLQSKFPQCRVIMATGRLPYVVFGCYHLRLVVALTLKATVTQKYKFLDEEPATALVVIWLSSILRIIPPLVYARKRHHLANWCFNPETIKSCSELNLGLFHFLVIVIVSSRQFLIVFGAF